MNDEVLYGECLSGALYWWDFLELSKEAGFADPRLVKDRPLAIQNPAIEAKLGQTRFSSATYRLFKISELESACEDYGQAVRYKGTIEHHPHAFLLDGHHLIEKGKVFRSVGTPIGCSMIPVSLLILSLWATGMCIMGFIPIAGADTIWFSKRRTQQGTRRGPAVNHRGPVVLLEVVPTARISL